MVASAETTLAVAAPTDACAVLMLARAAVTSAFLAWEYPLVDKARPPCRRSRRERFIGLRLLQPGVGFEDRFFGAGEVRLRLTPGGPGFFYGCACPCEILIE